jgi:hypothetical protein
MLKTRFQKYDKFSANTSLVQLSDSGENKVCSPLAGCIFALEMLAHKSQSISRANCVAHHYLDLDNL